MDVLVRPRVWLLAAVVCALAYLAVGIVAQRSAAEPAAEPTGFVYRVVRDGAPVALLRDCVGLGTASEVTEYRDGTDDSAQFHLAPGRVKQIRVTCQRPLSSDRTLADWRAQAITDIASARSAVEVQVLDPNATPVARWQLTNAWPVEVTVGLGDETLSLVADAFARVP